MAQIDRWTFKILSLPVFDESFSEAIAKTPLSNPTFVIALGARSQSEFTAKVGAIAETFVEGVPGDPCNQKNLVLPVLVL